MRVILRFTLLFAVLIIFTTFNGQCQKKSLIEALDSIVINELNHFRDTINVDFEKEYPIIIIDGHPISRSKLSRFDIKEINSITPISDTTTSVMFDNGRFGIIILRTNLSKRQLKRKL